jgi:hypothetical protein
VTDDHDTAGFFEAARRGELAVRYCCDCGRSIHMPAPVCPACRSMKGEWRVVSPLAKVFTFTVAERQVHPGFPTPHTLVVAALDDAPEVHILAHMSGRPPVKIGDAVEAVFEEIEDAAVLRWRPHRPK